MQKENEVVSIIIPTTGRIETLVQALESIRRQTYPDWEVLVVADGVDDDLFTKISSVAESEHRIKTEMRESDIPGAPSCRNQGLNHSNGEYLIFLDDDDCLAPDCLHSRVRIMKKNPGLDFSVSLCQMFKEVPGDDLRLLNIKTDQDDLERFLVLDVPWQTSSLIWRREALEKLGGWSCGLPSFQDWDLHIRAIAQGLKYQWTYNQPDSFWRLPQPAKDTVGRNSVTAEHLQSHLNLFLSVDMLLRDKDLMRAHRQPLIAGLLFWLAESWLKLGDRHEAISVWEKCYSDNLLTKKQYAVGRGVLLSPMKMLLRRLLRKMFFVAYPASFHAGDYSRTIRRSHVSNNMAIE